MDLVHRRVFMAASAASAAMPYLAHAETPTASNVAWGTITRAASDATYNNSQAVSDSAQVVDRWVAASATFRSQRPKHLEPLMHEHPANPDLVYKKRTWG